MILDKKDEYFLSIAKQDIHSFIMLGVITQGNPKLLARVAKWIDVDPDISSAFAITKKQITLAPELFSTWKNYNNSLQSPDGFFKLSEKQ